MAGPASLTSCAAGSRVGIRGPPVLQRARQNWARHPAPFRYQTRPPGDGFSPSLASLSERKGLGRKHVSAPPSGRFGISASRSHWLGSAAEGAGSPCLVSPD